MKKLLAALAVVLCLPAGFAAAGPAEDLTAAVQFAKEKNKAAATPLLDGIIADASASTNMKAQAYFVYAALESDPAAQIPYLDKAIAADPGFFRGYERKALRLFEIGKFSEAVEAADGALKLQPGNAGVLALKTKSLFSAGDYANAATTAVAALEAQPDNKEMPQYKAYSYYNAGDYANAATAFSDCLQADNRNGKLYLFRGHSYLLSHQQEKALEDLNLASRYVSQLTAQEQVDIHYYRGLAYLDTNRFDLASGSFNRALSANPSEERKAELERLITETADKKATYAAMEQTRKVLEKAKIEKVRNPYSMTGALQKIVADPLVTNELKAQAYVYLVNTVNSYEEKLAYAEKSLALDPQPDGYYYQAFARLFLEDPQGALGSFNRVLELAPTYLGAYHFRGMAYLDLGNWAAADADFSKVEEMNASWARSFSYIPHTRAKFMLGNIVAAKADLGAIRNEVSKQLKTYQAEYYYVRGLIAQYDKDYKEALELYKRALNTDGSGLRGRDLQKRISQLDSLKRWSQKR